MIKVKKQYLEYLARFVAKEEARYYLQGIYFDKENRALVATNGKQLGWIADAFEGELSKSRTVEISKPALMALKSLKKLEYVELEETDRGLVLMDCSTQMTMPYVDGTFPDWQRVVNSASEPVENIGLDPRLLADFKIKTPVLMIFSGKAGAIKVYIHEIENFEGLLMPCNVKDLIRERLG